MKLISLSSAILFTALSTGPAIASAASSQSIISADTSGLALPSIKGRKGSVRIGGYTSKGKGSRYVGGRK